MMASPTADDALDLYCKGIVFGLNGSSLLVKIANTLLKGMTFEDMRKSNERSLAGKGKKTYKSGGSIDIWKTISKKFEEIGKAVLENMGEKNDDL